MTTPTIKKSLTLAEASTVIAPELGVAPRSRPMTALQQIAIKDIGSEWRHAPAFTRSATLLSLEKRGLVECRMTPGSMAYLAMFNTPYNGSSYQWRLKPNDFDQPTPAENQKPQ